VGVCKDIGYLIDLQLGGKTGEIKARPLGTPSDLKIVGAIVKQDGNGIPGFQPMATEEMGDLVRARIKCGIT
jgi:hypothetical protein